MFIVGPVRSVHIYLPRQFRYNFKDASVRMDSMWYKFCVCTFTLCDYIKSLCHLCMPGGNVLMTYCIWVCVIRDLDVCVFAWMLFFMKVVHVYISMWGCEFLCVCMCMNARVTEHPYDKWLPGWLKRTLSLHNEHRRSISHCLWGTPGASAAKVPVISRISTNVD